MPPKYLARSRMLILGRGAAMDSRFDSPEDETEDRPQPEAE